MRAIATELRSQTEENFPYERGPSGKLARAEESWRTAQGRNGTTRHRPPGSIERHSGRRPKRASAAMSSTPLFISFDEKAKPHTILPRNGKALAFGEHVAKGINYPGSVIPARSSRSDLAASCRMALRMK